MKELSGIEKFVAEDIAARQQVGIKKYGTTVDGNPLPLVQWLRHAYEESLDLPVYLRRAIAEMEESESRKNYLIRVAIEFIRQYGEIAMLKIDYDGTTRDGYCLANDLESIIADLEGERVESAPIETEARCLDCFEGLYRFSIGSIDFGKDPVKCSQCEQRATTLFPKIPHIDGTEQRIIQNPDGSLSVESVGLGEPVGEMGVDGVSGPDPQMLPKAEFNYGDPVSVKCVEPGHLPTFPAIVSGIRVDHFEVNYTVIDGDGAEIDGYTNDWLTLRE